MQTKLPQNPLQESAYGGTHLKNQIFTIFISFSVGFFGLINDIFPSLVFFVILMAAGQKLFCQKMSLLWYVQQINKYGNKKLKNGLNLRLHTWVIFCFGPTRLKEDPKETEIERESGENKPQPAVGTEENQLQFRIQGFTFQKEKNHKQTASKCKRKRSNLL